MWCLVLVISVMSMWMTEHGECTCDNSNQCNLEYPIQAFILLSLNSSFSQLVWLLHSNQWDMFLQHIKYKYQSVTHAISRAVAQQIKPGSNQK